MIPIYAQAIILRCTGPGGIRWQHVAQQLGRSEAAVRSDFDPTYLKNDTPAARPPRPVSENPFVRPGRLSPLLVALYDGPKSNRELQAAVSDSGHDFRISNRLGPLMDNGMVRRMYPAETARAVLCYGLTNKGRARVDTLIGGDE